MDIWPSSTPLPLRREQEPCRRDRRDATCRSTAPPPPPSGSTPPRCRHPRQRGRRLWRLRWRLRLICLIWLGHCSGGAEAIAEEDGTQPFLWQASQSHVRPGRGGGSGRHPATATTEAEETGVSNRGQQIEQRLLSASTWVAVEVEGKYKILSPIP